MQKKKHSAEPAIVHMMLAAAQVGIHPHQWASRESAGLLGKKVATFPMMPHSMTLQ